MLTCLVATNPQARAHILAKVGNAIGSNISNGSSVTQGSIEVSTCQSNTTQGSKVTNQGICEGRNTAESSINANGSSTNQGSIEVTSCQRLNKEGPKEVEEAISTISNSNILQNPTISNSIPNTKLNQGRRIEVRSYSKV